MLNHQLNLLLAVTFFAVTSFSGCGSAEQKYNAPTEIATVTPSQRAKGWLESVAASGQIDSGISVLPSTLDEMHTQDGVDITELKHDAELLSKSRDSAEIKKLAKKMAEKIEVKTVASKPVK